MGPKPSSEISEKILGAFLNTPVMNVAQVAGSVNITRITAKKHLDRLAHEGRIMAYSCGRDRIFLRQDESNSISHPSLQKEDTTVNLEASSKKNQTSTSIVQSGVAE